MARKTLLAIAQSLASEINLTKPQQVASSADGSAVKLLALINAACDDLKWEYDWEVLVKRYELTTVDGQSAYDFPTDIDRWLSGTFYDSSRSWDLLGPLTAPQWEYILAQNVVSSPRTRYRVFGGQIHFDPAPTGFTIVYEYISENYAVSGTGDEKNTIDQDSDEILFDHRLVIYLAKLKWIESLRGDTTAALNDFNRALEFAKGADVPAARLDARGPCSTSRLLSSQAQIPDTIVGL